MTTAHVPRLSGVGWGSPRARLAVAAGQILLIVLVGWLWATASSDPSATTVDWPFVWLVIASPIALAVSGWVGWKAKRRAGSMGTRATRSVAGLAEWTTLGLFALSMSVAPIVVLGALVFDRMG